MKKSLIFIMLVFMISILAGCITTETTTETTTGTTTSTTAGTTTGTTTAAILPTSWPVGVWIVPVGDAVPAYLQDFDDERAIKLYMDRDASTHDATLVASEYFFEIAIGEGLCMPDSVGPAETCMLTLSGALFIDSSMIGSMQISYIYTNGEEVFASEPAIDVQMTAGATSFCDRTVTIPTQPGQYTFDFRLAFVDIPRVVGAQVYQYSAEGQLIGGQILVISGGGGPWTSSPFSEVAYVIVEETLVGGVVQRTLYPRVPGETTLHDIKIPNDFGIFEHHVLTIDWGE